jgi:hypothetical protein
MDPPPEEGNFCDDSNCPMKPHIMQRYNQNMGYIKNSDCMANSYLMSHFQVEHKIVFPPSGSNSTQQMDSVIIMLG